MIDKLKIINVKEIQNKAGNIIKFVSKKNVYFNGFGEVYFNEIKKGYQKGWNFHKKATCIFYVAYGSVTFTVLSRSKEKKKIITIKRKSPKILIIPAKCWFKFRSNAKHSIVVNFTNLTHDKKEVLKYPL